MENLFAAFTGPGAAFSYAIVIVFAYGLSVFIERMLKFTQQWSTEMDSVRGFVLKQEYQKAQDAAKEHPVGNLIAVAVKKKGITWDDLAEVSPLVEQQVRRRISSLGTVANISTMLGLLGTVYGLIYALEGLDDASSIERTARLSTGIAAAMLTTAWGLLAGLPAMFAHNILSAKAEDTLAQCQSIAASLIISQQSSDDSVK